MTYETARRMLPGWLRRRLYSFETMIEDSVSAFAAGLSEGARVLDAGAGEGRFSAQFARQRYTGVDLAIGDAAWDYSQLDLLADLERLPFGDGAFDAALSIVTLEHLRRPAAALEELGRVLKRGAGLLLVAPLEWEEHQAPHDYFRYTRYGLRYLLEGAGFEVVEVSPAGGLFQLLSRRLLNAGQAAWWLLPVAAPAALAISYLDGLDGSLTHTLGFKCIARKL